MTTELHPDDAGYPARLKDLARAAPDPLYALGETPWPDVPLVTIVGSRAATRYGRAVAARIAARCAAAGVGVVSGLALGIDGAAHRAALDRGGWTIAVLGGGIDRVYPPEHASLYTAIARSGRVLSPWPGGTQPAHFRFPARNRVLAALGEVTVVVQADAQSGSRYTVRSALALGRAVRVAPWPLDHPAYAGNAAWARDRRCAVLDSADEPARLAAEAWAAHRQRVEPPDDRARLEHALAAGPRTLDALARAAGLPVAAAARAATALEIAGRIERTSGDRYRRRPH